MSSFDSRDAYIEYIEVECENVDTQNTCAARTA